MADKGEENWVRMCLIREGAVELSRRIFQDLWSKSFACDGGNPWESTPGNGRQLWDMITTANVSTATPTVAFETHEEAFIRSGEIEIWELQIISKICKFFGLPDHLNLAQNFSETFAGLLKKSSCDVNFVNHVISQTLPVLQQWMIFDMAAFLTTDIESAKLHLKVMEILRKGHMLRVFKEDKLKAIDKYGEVIGLTTDDDDVNLAITYVLRSAFELAAKDESEAKKCGVLLLTLAERRAKTQSDSWQALLDLGKVYKLLGDREKSLAALNKAQVLNPTNAEIQTLKHSVEEHAVLSEPTLAQTLKKLREQVGVKISGRDLLDIGKIVHEKLGSHLPLATGLTLLLDGIRCEEGFERTPVDLKKAVEFYEKSITFGSAEAMYRLSRLYLKGSGVPKDLKKSAKLLEDAVLVRPLSQDEATFLRKSEGDLAPGVASAMQALGEYYHEGIYYPKSCQRALSWFTKALDNGYADAGFYIGNYYAQGIVVKRDMDKAKQYWKIAADVGHVNSMVNLAIWYLDELGNVKMAQEWIRRAKEKGVEVDTIRELEKMVRTKKDTLGKLQSLEAEVGINPELDAKLRDRINRAMSAHAPPECSELLAQMSGFLSQNSDPTPEGSGLSSCISLNLLKPYVMKGMKYAAQIARALTCYDMVQELVCADILSGVAMNDEEIVVLMAEFYRFNCEFAVGFTHVMTDRLCSSVKRVINSKPGRDLELEARVCWIGLYFKNLDEEYAAASVDKFPEDLQLWVFYLQILAFKNDFEKVIRLCKTAMKLHPDKVELLYVYATSLRLCLNEDSNKQKIEECVKQYSRFIELAPRDHRKVPEAFYAIASIYSCRALEDETPAPGTEEAIKKYMADALQAEKDQLPCFLPYDSPSKKSAELCMKILAFKPQKKHPQTRKKSTPPTTSTSNLAKRKSWDEKILSDPQRIAVTICHRKMFSEVKNFLSATQIHVHTTLQPPRKQCAAACPRSVKPITLTEMDASKDHVYTGRQIKLTCIEDGVRMTGLMFIAEDANGDTQRLSVYNTTDGDSGLMYGSKITILNPYMRMAQDGKPMIRVDDPACITYHLDEYDPDRCRYCGASAASFKCGKCQRAKYCRKECQTKDWKILKHSMICKT